MMQMLAAGGMEILTDNLRKPDEDNPKGYYEFERVKQLPKGDNGWLKDARGKAVKIIATLLEHLPHEYTYKVIFMHRRMEEILASQRKMLIRRGESPDRVDDETMAKAFQRHVEKVQAWLRGQSNIAVLNVDYSQLVSDPWLYLDPISDFLGTDLKVEKMASVVDPSLHRNRASALSAFEM